MDYSTITLNHCYQLCLCATTNKYIYYSFSMSPINISTFFNNIVRLVWRRDVGKRQTNIGSLFFTSTLNVTTLNNVESTLSILVLILTTFDNVETTLSFLTSRFTTLTNFETTLWIWPYAKKMKNKLRVRSNKIFLGSNKNHLKLNMLNSKVRLLFHNLVHFIPHFKTIMEKNICKAGKTLKKQKFCITRSLSLSRMSVSF